MGVLDDLTGAFKESMTINWSGATVWMTYILYAFFVVAVLGAVWILLKYRIKVTYYPLMGDPNDKDNTTATLGRPKKDYGAYIKDKNGNEFFSFLFARKKVKPVPYKLRYQDGVFFLRKSNSEFQAIARPILGNPSVSLYVTDPEMDLWASVQKQQISARTADEDVNKRNMIMTTVVALGCLVFVGFVIWFIMGMASQTIAESVSKGDQIIDALKNFATSGGGPG